MVEASGLSLVQNEQNFFQLRQPETLAISLISSRRPMRGKAAVPFTDNYTH